LQKVTIKNSREIKLLRQGGQILAEIFEILREKIAIAKLPLETLELEDLARKELKKRRCKGAFLGYHTCGKDFPAALCVSLNDEIVHGVPEKGKLIEPGDLVSLDLGVEYKGLITDSAFTLGVGELSPVARKLMDATECCLKEGLKELGPGKPLGNFGYRVEEVGRKAGFRVVRDLVGHGVGYEVHEPPQIFNFGTYGGGLRLEPGMVLAFEPMLVEGEEEIAELEGHPYTFLTADEKLSAHFEHTVVITEKGYEVITRL